MKMAAALILAMAFASPAIAQFHVVPSNYANASGNTTFTGPLTAGERTYQLLVHESLLTDLVGQQLTGLSWRLPPSASSSWPASDMVFNNYDIYLSGSVTPADRSLTFADNIVGPQTQVRSGALAVPMGSYGSGNNPNAWGPEIGFNAWTYNGGHLLVEIRHTGNGQSSRSVDAIGTSVAGYGTLFSAAWQSNYSAANGMQGNFSIFRFTAVPGPSALVAIGAGFALIGQGRRRRA